ncbi:MAG: hypothetical protein WCO84_01025 [bacterium]
MDKLQIDSKTFYTPERITDLITADLVGRGLKVKNIKYRTNYEAEYDYFSGNRYVTTTFDGVEVNLINE